MGTTFLGLSSTVNFSTEIRFQILDLAWIIMKIKLKRDILKWGLFLSIYNVVLHTAKAYKLR